MAIRVAIRHKTVYSYDRLVAVSPHIFRLRPAVHSRTAVESYSLKIEPKQPFLKFNKESGEDKIYLADGTLSDNMKEHTD